MEIKKASWLEGFSETCRDIMEDTLLLDALAMYAANDSFLSTTAGTSASPLRSSA